MKKISLKVACLVILTFFFTFTTIAQKWTNYTTTDGLADNFVTSIAIDVHGNKWFGTYNGVSKFDGSNWTTYRFNNTANGLVNNWVNAIIIDVKGDIWFGTNGGVSKFDGANWTTYTTKDGLTENAVEIAFAIDDLGNKWFGTNHIGVSKFDGTHWTTYTTKDGLADDWVQSICIDSQGNKWFGIIWSN